MKIVFIHMLNNFSGSPNVLSVVIRNLINRGYEVKLITSKGIGFLSNIENVQYQYTVYKWNRKNKLETFIRFFLAQLQIFFIILCSSNKKTLFYINTVVPFGAAIACKFSKKMMVYHCHENMMQVKPFYSIYRNVYKWANVKSIFVSNYVAAQAYGCRNGRVVYNGLSKDFYDSADLYSKTKATERNTILMVCSLRRYKGIYEFVEIARCMLDFNFEIVFSDEQSDVDKFASEIKPSSNLRLFSKQSNLHPFYARAKILLSLSHPTAWVETFGLTIIEAMIHGIPAIVPHVGGPAELVQDGVNGFVVNPLDIKDVITKIRNLNDVNCYNSFSVEALKRASEFTMYTMVDSIEEYIKE